MSHRLAVAVAAAVVAGGAGTACGPQSTSFRPIEGPDPNHTGPPSVAYDVWIAGQLAARAHVWSSGGYVSSGDAPMTQIGFEINSATMRTMTFDGDALELLVFDRDGGPLPPTRLSTITPLGPTLVTVPAASTVMLGTYFQLPVAPRSVGSMQVRWTLRLDADDYRQITGFLRDDDAELVEHVPLPGSRAPSS
jgi:hypothetical protein